MRPPANVQVRVWTTRTSSALLASEARRLRPSRITLSHKCYDKFVGWILLSENLHTSQIRWLNNQWFKMSLVVKEELRKFAETTSIRGISRAFKTTNEWIRTVWALSVIVCVAVLVWQTTTIVVRYFKHESSTLLTEGDQHAVSSRCIIFYTQIHSHFLLLLQLRWRTSINPRMLTLWLRLIALNRNIVGLLRPSCI